MFGRKTARALADMASRLDLAEKRLDRLDGGTEKTVLVSTEGGVFEMTLPPGADESEAVSAEVKRRYGECKLTVVKPLSERTPDESTEERAKHARAAPEGELRSV